MALDVSIRKYGSVPVLQVAGRIVDVDAKRFSRRLEALCNKGGQLIVVDITRVNFIDSHGLGILVYFQTIMQRSSRELVILNSNLNPNAYTNRLFDLTNLNKVMRIIGSLNDLGIDTPKPLTSIPH